MGRLAEGRAEAADEVSLRNARDPRERGDVERLVEGPVHGVTGPEQAAVELFDGAAHEAKTRGVAGLERP